MTFLEQFQIKVDAALDGEDAVELVKQRFERYGRTY